MSTFMYNSNLHNCRSVTLATNVQAVTPIVMYLPSQ